VFATLFGQKAARAEAAASQAPAGMRIYAVGDIHGRLDLLDQVAGWIARDMEGCACDGLTIFLGDYVDRGPNSAGVLERLSGGDFPTRFEALRGNHEDVMLRILDDAASIGEWRQLGGLATLHSYGVPVADALRGQNYARAREDFLEKLPARHIEFLRATRLCAEAGDYFFCHAGVRPGVALDRQSPGDLLWIRGEFLNFQGSFGKRVVHGHTPVEHPEVLPNRINLDTGGFATGALTCAALEGPEVRLFTTGRPAPSPAP
jgi:serine/threonine protein phosphatase 1